MNSMRKKKAVAEFSADVQHITKQGMEEKLTAAGYKPDEITELISEWYPNNQNASADAGGSGTPPDENNDKGSEPGPAPEVNEKQEEKKKDSELRKYLKCKVKPVMKKMTIPGLGTQDVLTGYQKTGEVLQTTEITERHAKTLNAQTPNNYIYYFAVGEDLFLPAEKWHQ